MVFAVGIMDAMGRAEDYDRLLQATVRYAELTLPAMDRELADLRALQADRLFVAQDYPAAQALRELVLRARRAAKPVDDAALADALSDLEITLSLQGNYAAALPYATEAVAVARRLGRPALLADALWREGRVLLEAGRNTDAETRLREADLLNARGGAERRAARVLALDQLAVALFEQRRVREARDVAVLALALSREVDGERGERTLALIGDIATFDRDLGELERAETALRQAVAIAEASPKASVRTRLRLYSALSSVLVSRGRAVEAVRMLGDLTGAIGALDEAEQRDLSDLLQNYATALTEVGRLDEAEVIARRVVAIRKAALRPDDPAIGRALGALGLVLDRLDRLEDALKVQIEAANLLMGNGRDDAALARDDVFIVAVGNVATTLVKLDRLAEAKPFQELALRLARAGFPAESDDLANALNRWAQYRKAMRVCDGLAAAREAQAIWARRSGAVSPDRVVGDINLASYLRMCRGDPAEQRAYWRDAVRYLLADAGQSTDYDARARTLLRDRRIAFLGTVDANWQLGAMATPRP
ncbi:tetratricopeptide repeat protein [Sphingomonas sp. ST-64]|uniref:Tetratricopeptide repeat protein n=1 Tax=Sphingomonas plantiphila TaxID=3163295 RepID=A0ABW8YRA4_9SPHN